MTAKTIADPIASIAPSSPTRKRSCWRSVAAPGAAVGDQERAVGHGRDHERVGRDVERALDPGGVRGIAEGQGIRLRVDRRGPDRPADPEPGDRGVAPCRGRVVGQGTRLARLGEVHRDLRVVRQPAGPHAQVGAGGIAQVAEGERLADDRDEVARLEASLPIRPGARRPPMAPSDRSAPPGTWTRSRSSICVGRVGLGGAERPVGPQRQSGRPLAERARPVAPALRRLDLRIAREDAQLARRVADPEADGLLLDDPAAAGRAVAVVVDDRAVVDARHALEQRDEGHLGGFDDPADADLAGRDRRDRRGRRVGDAGRDPVPAHAAPEEREAADDAHTGRPRRPTG